MNDQQVTLVDYEESAQALARERFTMADAVREPEQTFCVEKEEY